MNIAGKVLANTFKIKKYQHFTNGNKKIYRFNHKYLLQVLHVSYNGDYYWSISTLSINHFHPTLL